MRTRLTALVATVVLAVPFAACSSGRPTPAPAATVASSPVSTSTAPPTTPAGATATPSRSPVAVTSTSTPLAPPGPTAPPGYASSCASAHPWGQQVRAPFVCIEAPAPGLHVSRGAALTVRGYAGGSFENNVVVEARALLAGGQVARATLVLTALTYLAPDAGMPGFWETTLRLPASGQPGSVRVLAYFESPRDGSRATEATVDVVLD